jgi:hypothetical protein
VHVSLARRDSEDLAARKKLLEDSVYDVAAQRMRRQVELFKGFGLGDSSFEKTGLVVMDVASAPPVLTFEATYPLPRLIHTGDYYLGGRLRAGARILGGVELDQASRCKKIKGTPRLRKEQITVVTPLDLPIVQPYRKVKRKQVITSMQSVYISAPNAPAEGDLLSPGHDDRTTFNGMQRTRKSRPRLSHLISSIAWTPLTCYLPLWSAGYKAGYVLRIILW